MRLCACSWRGVVREARCRALKSEAMLRARSRERVCLEPLLAQPNEVTHKVAGLVEVVHHNHHARPILRGHQLVPLLLRACVRACVCVCVVCMHAGMCVCV